MNKYNIGDVLKIVSADGERSAFNGMTLVVNSIYDYPRGICYGSNNNALEGYIFYENEVEAVCHDDDFNDEYDEDDIDAIIDENIKLRYLLLETQEKLIEYQNAHIEVLMEMSQE